jgi:alpha-aminoadipic semialdehyde synthase
MALRDAIGIVRETKNRFERRVPLIPTHVAELVADGIEVRVERSPTRAFSDEEFSRAGATLVDDPWDARVVMGVKEVAPGCVRAGQTVLCFSHTTKGQPHNMPLLRRFMAEGASLVDYELITDDRKARQVAFGRYAGIAGAHETLWTLGHRLQALGRETPLTVLRHAVDYPGMTAMVTAAREALERWVHESRDSRRPVIFAVTGEGRVSKGALEYFTHVGARFVTLEDCIALRATATDVARDFALGVLPLRDAQIYLHAARPFDFEHFREHPEQYVSTCAAILPYVDGVVNGSYWDARFPRLLDASALRRAFADGTIPLVLGDIACDIGGGIEWTVRATDNDAPAFVYDPHDGSARIGVLGAGVAVMAVDNLPCALSREASEEFSRALLPFVRPIFLARLERGPLDALPAALQSAVIVAAGRLTPRHAKLAAHLVEAAASTRAP